MNLIPPGGSGLPKIKKGFLRNSGLSANHLRLKRGLHMSDI